MKIGIAGYMGAGKTTCARFFESDDALVIDADAEAKALMARDRQLQRDLQDAFGGAVINGDKICTDALGRAAFESVGSLSTLNKITHPPLVNHLKRLVLDCAKRICILDAALIPMWDIDSWFDLRVWADAPFETRLARIKAKRGDVDEKELIGRMRLQEEMMPVPGNDRWNVLPDADCIDYVRAALAAAGQPRIP